MKIAVQKIFFNNI